MSTDDLPIAASSPFDDESADGVATLVPAGAPPAKPRLSILHLLVWTATSAAMMAIMRMPDEAAIKIPAYFTAIRVFFAMYGGVVTGGIVLWAARRWRGVSFPTEPGEWLLIAQGNLVLLSMAAGLLGGWFARGSEAFGKLLVGTMLLVVFAIGLCPALCYRRTGIWRWFLRIFALLCVMPFLGNIAATLGGEVLLGLVVIVALLIMLVAAICFWVAVGSDLKHHIVRGWIHWTGVWSLISLVVLYIAAVVIAFIARFR